MKRQFHPICWLFQTPKAIHVISVTVRSTVSRSIQQGFPVSFQSSLFECCPTLKIWFSTHLPEAVLLGRWQNGLSEDGYAAILQRRISLALLDASIANRPMVSFSRTTPKASHHGPPLTQFTTHRHFGTRFVLQCYRAMEENAVPRGRLATCVLRKRVWTKRFLEHSMAEKPRN